MNASGTQRVAALGLSVPSAEHQPGPQAAAEAETGVAPVRQPDSFDAPTLPLDGMGVRFV